MIKTLIPNCLTEEIIEEQTEPERVFIKPGKRATRKEIEAELASLGEPAKGDGWGQGYRAALRWALGRDAENEEDYLMF